MTLGKPYWNVSGDSTVAMPVLWDPTTRNWHCRVLNAKARGAVISETDLALGWTPTPRIDLKWLNPGSRWVAIPDCLDPIERVPLRPRKWDDMVKLSVELKGVNSGGFVNIDGAVRRGVPTAYALMSRYVRLWDGNKHPAEPTAFNHTHRKPRSRVKPSKTALDFILEDDD